ncbi:MAG: monovalent cation:proton antiporter-2 (CPA2) family protein [Comamonadaceae bacterium]|nr:monovalent cation:proton antiporter-2 (CPA2) family protein [Burkholderiales bacterium]MEB2347898.1 monovalent cation:proton antiporter-2 (CPA2) family protein [Comamonadaceae bacterium]
MSSLALTLLYLLAAVLGVVACRMLRLPPMMGYLAAGILIGPHALALALNSEGVRHLGEFGVVFLMFAIGLEFSLPKLRAMRRLVFGLGLLQVVGCVLVFMTGLLALAAWRGGVWDMGWQTALALGGTMAMSSTAIVVKLLAERAEIDTEHGQRVLGILLFQDLAVVPLLVLIPALGSSPEELLGALAFAFVKAALLVAVLLVGGQRVMRWWLTLVARRKSEELFMLNLLLVTLGLAWLTELAGLSLALGAFIAGVLVSETPYHHQVGSDIRPFHDVLLGLFFITVGMMLDWHIVVEHWALVGLLLLVPLAVKTAIIFGLAHARGASAGVALRTGLYAAQAGEFGFVLLALMQTHELIEPRLMNPVLAAMVLSMLATPFLIQYSPWIVTRLVASDWMQQSLQMTQIARRSINTAGHIVICGYGRCGQNLARLLELEGIAYLALDLDPDRVRQAAAAGNSVVFGDATRVQALRAAGLARAAAVVVTTHEVPVALKVLARVGAQAPQVPVIVRTQDDTHLEQLRAAGAAEVVPEAIEGSLVLAGHALALVGVPLRHVVRLLQEQRNARYGLLRNYFHGQDETPTERDQERLASITLPEGAATIGQPAAALPLAALGVQLVAVRRANGHTSAPGDHRALAAGDTLVLSGMPAALGLAEESLLRG